MKNKDHYINHVALVVDKSSSMYNHSSAVVAMFENIVAYLRLRSLELNQETRVSLYMYNHIVTCDVFDMDVTRLETIRGEYTTSGMTALLDATMLAITDMEKLPEIYGDHGFLIYNLTDGCENRSRIGAATLAKKIQSLPENWTLAAMVPDRRGMQFAKSFGFPEGNCEEWDTSKDFANVESRIRDTVTTYMDSRAKGVRGTKSLFTTDMKSVQVSAVRRAARALNVGQFNMFKVNRGDLRANNGVQIRDFVEAKTGNTYVKGTAFYELTKSETIQDYKGILLENRTTGELFDNGRDILGLPTSGDTKVKPGDHGNWRIFVSSTSVNRKLLQNTDVIVLT